MSRWFAACLLSMAFVAALPWASAQDKELLWPKGAPAAKGTAAADKPELSTYLPPKDQATGAAAGGCPGRGYGGLGGRRGAGQGAPSRNARRSARVLPRYPSTPPPPTTPLADGQ